MIYGYRYGVRSSRKLERKAMLNIEARWLLGEVVPANKTIANFRKENAEAFRNIFRKFVFLLKELGLVLVYFNFERKNGLKSSVSVPLFSFKEQYK